MDEQVILNFLHDFNAMCQANRRDFLIRERLVTYESGSRIKRYDVQYKMKMKKNRCEVFAQSQGFWIFKKKFLLIRIEWVDGLINITGMYTEALNSPFSDLGLKKKLNQYIEICRDLPQNAFVKS